jgi:hypothetical protein
VSSIHTVGCVYIGVCLICLVWVYLCLHNFYYVGMGIFCVLQEQHTPLGILMSIYKELLIMLQQMVGDNCRSTKYRFCDPLSVPYSNCIPPQHQCANTWKYVRTQIIHACQIMLLYSTKMLNILKCYI